MKKIISNYSNKRNLVIILFLMLIAAFSILSEVNAQSRRGFGGRGGSMGRGGIGRGSFMHMPRHSMHIAPRIGARIRVLPFGYMSFWFGGVPYYYNDGIYYQYYPENKTYAVVDKPAGVENVSDLKFDQVKMSDGSILEGIFEGATDSTITMKLGNKNHDIKISNIVSITFAPSIKDTTQQK